MRKLSGAVLVIALIAAAGCSYIGKSLTNRHCTEGRVERPYVIQPQTIAVDGVNIAYMETGEGPWVVMIHGGIIPFNYYQSFTVMPFAPGLPQAFMHSGAFSAADSWNYNIKAVAAEGFRVVALDLPGFGASDKPDLDYTLEDFTTFLGGFMRAKGIDRATLVGHGLGGSVAILYALEHTLEVDRLILVSSFGSYDGRSLLNLPRWAGVRRLQKEKAGRAEMYMIGLDKIFDRWEGNSASTFYLTLSEDIKNASPAGKMMIFVDRNEPNTKEFIEAMVEYKKSYVKSSDFPKEVQAAHLAMLEAKRTDLAKRFKEIQVPVMIIHGYYDPIVSREAARYMEFAFPRAILVNFNKSGHYPMIEENCRFNSDILMFLTAKDCPVAFPAK